MGPGNVPVGPALEVKAKTREAGGNRWSPGRLGLMATGVITCLPGWQAADCGSFLFNVWSGPGISERKRIMETLWDVPKVTQLMRSGLLARLPGFSAVCREAGRRHLFFFL